MAETVKSAVAVVGIDIGKNSFHVVGLDRRGAVVLRQRWSRGQVEARLLRAATEEAPWYAYQCLKRAADSIGLGSFNPRRAILAGKRPRASTQGRHFFDSLLLVADYIGGGCHVRRNSSGEGEGPYGRSACQPDQGRN